MQVHKTAILLFTRSLEAEFKAKSFGLTKDRFRVVYHSLLKKTYQTLNTANLPIFEFNSQRQVGNAFGERLTHAIKAIQKQGYDRVIIVGNDAPDLNTAILKKAIDTVAHGNHILGRDTHGGCYLMGFTINAAVLQALQGISWHSNQVFSQLNRLLKADTTLPLLADINQKEDFAKALLMSAFSRRYLTDLLKLIFSNFFKNILTEAPLLKGHFSTTGQRGPPALA